MVGVVRSCVAMLSSLLFLSTFVPASTAFQSRAMQRSGRRLLTTSNNMASHNGAAEEQTVAIIGGGIAGLSCASSLLKQNKLGDSSIHYVPTVFDTGRLRPGGRCSSRYPGDDNGKGNSPIWTSQTVVDHAAQILHVHCRIHLLVHLPKR